MVLRRPVKNVAMTCSQTYHQEKPYANGPPGIWAISIGEKQSSIFWKKWICTTRAKTSPHRHKQKGLEMGMISMECTNHPKDKWLIRDENGKVVARNLSMTEADDLFCKLTNPVIQD